MKKTELGAWGETQAAKKLERAGFRIVERNFRTRFGEIDLIARKNDILAFVEVKLRKNKEYGSAREFVTASKQRKIRMAAESYLSCRSWAQELQPRFDVVEVYAPLGMGGTADITHLENAFE